MPVALPALPALMALTLEVMAGFSVHVCLSGLPRLQLLQLVQLQLGGQHASSARVTGSGMPAASLEYLYLSMRRAEVDFAAMPALRTALLFPIVLEGGAGISAARGLMRLAIGGPGEPAPWVDEVLCNAPPSLQLLGRFGDCSGRAAEAVGRLSLRMLLLNRATMLTLPRARAPIWRHLRALDLRADPGSDRLPQVGLLLGWACVMGGLVLVPAQQRVC